MASNRMIRREIKRARLVANTRERRVRLITQLKNSELGIQEKFDILQHLESMPRDASKVRLTRRCRMTGRAHGVYRKFGLGRNELRRRAMLGEVPGLVKASW